MRGSERLLALLLGAVMSTAGAQDAAGDAAPDPGGADAPAAQDLPRAGAGEGEDGTDGLPLIPVADLSPTTPPPQSAPASPRLEEIVVTAQRRRESLQQTPVSVEAFNADKLQQRGIEGVADLAVNVPGMTITPFPTDTANLLIFIRGIGLTDSQITQDPPIGIYLDGVYIARTAGLAMDLADLERIEVLRGPQGTLYGRNTTGGAINLITREPSPWVFAATHRIGIDDRLGYTARSSLNLPLGDELGVKLAVLGSGAHGFVDNTGPGEDFGDRRQKGLRLDGSWQPLSWLGTRYAFDYSNLRYANTMFQAVLTPESDHGQAESFKRYGQANTIYSAHRLDSLSSGPPFEASSMRSNGHALTLTADIESLQLKYIAAYRTLYEANYADLGGGLGSLSYRLDSNAYDGPAATVANGGPTPLVVPTLTQRQWSHELQLSGDLFDDRFRFIAGAFYFSEDASEVREPLSHQFSSALDPEQTADLVALLPPDLALQVLETAAPRVVNFVEFRRDIENTSYALFGQGTWTPDALERRLHLTLGYRHSSDRRRAVKTQHSDTYLEYQVGGHGAAAPLQSAEPFDDVHAARDFGNNSYNVIAAFDLTPTINLYAKRDQAYKSGGFNTRDPQVSGDSGPASDGNDYGFGFVEGFAPEHVHSYELGIKSEWLDRRVRVNADVFDTAYRDMQINVLISGTIADTKIRNAGRARMRGLELDTTWLALADLTLSASYAYLDARVLEVRDIDGNNVADDYPFTSAPVHAGSAAIDWTALRGDFGDLRLHLNYGYTGARTGQGQPGRKGLTALPAFGVLGARASLARIRLGRGDMDVALWGKNLIDEEYPVAAIDNLPHADRAVLWGEPRSFGLDLVYRYE